jgi:hypothetical protein
MAIKFHPPSLLKYFESPEGYAGTFALLCAYSADADFLDEMMLRFTGKTKPFRASEGNINSLLILDKGNEQISMTHVPGLYHAARIDSKEQPFKLMHAKLALLHFKNKDKPGKFILRLLVSTGNWTRETVNESLDLIANIELSSEEINSTETHITQKRADLYAANEFTTWLLQFYNCNLVTKNKNHEIFSLQETFFKCLNELRKPRDVDARFFDNRNQALVAQLSKKVIVVAGKKARNYIAIGSGFFQKPVKKNTIPSVITKIREELTDAELLTHSCDKEIFVNPEGCQAIVSSFKALKDDNWLIRQANDPINPNNPRSLHAKFIFSSNGKNTDGVSSSPWLYMGSGNMTEAGFLNKANKAFGNLEIGVIINAVKLHWRYNKKLEPQKCVDVLLPLQWETVFTSAEKLNIGSEFIEKENDYVSPPISWFEWHKEKGESYLIEGEKTQINYYVLDLNKNKCTKNTNGHWIWPHNQPAEVDVVWGNQDEYSCSVPIIDSFGKVARKKLSDDLSLSEVIWQLEGFPDSYSDNTEEQDEIVEEATMNESDAIKSTTGTEKYPIRAVMEIIERIAEMQTSVKKQDWIIWCSRLEQSIFQTRNNSIYNVFKKMGINPFSTLRESAFRPDYSLINDSKEKMCYETMLNKIDEYLELGNLKRI